MDLNHRVLSIRNRGQGVHRFMMGLIMALYIVNDHYVNLKRIDSTIVFNELTFQNSEPVVIMAITLLWILLGQHDGY